MIVILVHTFLLRHCVNKLLVTGNKGGSRATQLDMITVTLNIRLNEACFPSCISHSSCCFGVLNCMYLHRQDERAVESSSADDNSRQCVHGTTEVFVDS